MKGKLIVHFGSTYKSAREKVLDILSYELADGYVSREAYTSSIVRGKLIEKGIKKLSIEEAVTELINEGVKEIEVIPTFIIDGIEYEKAKKEVIRLCKEKTFSYKFGKPLMYDEKSMELLSKVIGEIIGDCSAYDAILLCGHGSDSLSDERYHRLSEILTQKLGTEVITANMEGRRSFRDVIGGLKERKIKKVLILPSMLVYGDHGHNDIEGKEDSLIQLLEKAGIKYEVISKGLGEYKEIRKIFIDREEDYESMESGELKKEPEYIKNPIKIEEESMEIIREELKKRHIEYRESDFPVIGRIIHTTGDPDYVRYISISSKFIDKAKEELKKGCRIYCDTNMIVSGVNKKACEKLDVKPFTYISSEEVAKNSREKAITRSMAGIDLAVEEGITCFAFGNAPTALYRLLEHVRSGRVKPKFIIGVPVGFVGAAESKDYLKTFDIEQIRINGNRGGSNIAVSILNALLYEVAGR